MVYLQLFPFTSFRTPSMPGASRIDKMHRTLPTGEVDVVFVIRREDIRPSAAWIADEEFPRQPDEGVDALVDRALRDYRVKHPPQRPVSALIVDCSR